MGELHTLEGVGIVSRYVTDLHVALRQRKQCLDYYLETSLPDMRRATATQIPVMAGGGSNIRSGLYYAHNKAIESRAKVYPAGFIPYIRYHYSDGRQLTKADINADLEFPEYWMLQDTPFMYYIIDLISRITKDPKPVTKTTQDDYIALNGALPKAASDGSLLMDYTPDELLALYYGVGPSSTQSGEPCKSLQSRYKKKYDNIKTAAYLVIEDIGPLTPGIEYPHANLMSLDDLATLRSRCRKTLKLFLRRHRHRCSPKKLYQAMKAAVVWSGRSYQSEGLPVYCIEAFADIYTFLRMFRVFDGAATDPKSPCPHGAQKNIIYHSHTGHSTTMIVLINMVFGAQPTKVFGTITTFIPEMRRRLKRAIESPETQLVPMPTYVPNVHELVVPSGTTFFDDRYDIL